MKSRKLKRNLILIIAAGILLLIAAMMLAQTLVAHRPGSVFLPDYDRIDLTALLAQDKLTDEDYALLLCQTGLGRSAADKLLSAGEVGRAAILQTQDAFFAPVQPVCDPLLGWFTREDHLENAAGETVYAPALVDLQPGDIILTLSTHSLGWRHGHAGLVVETESGLSVLECVVLGTDSKLMTTSHWRRYSNYAVLRVKGLDAQDRSQTARYALENLVGIPYHLTSGFIGPKAPAVDSFYFGLHCSYLVWYAWNAMGYDLDSDGGRLASTYDLLHSDLLEVVQIYGMDPREWISSKE